MQSNIEFHLLKKRTWRRWLLVGTLVVILFINGAGLFVGNIIYQETSVLHSRLNAQKEGRLKQLLEFGKLEKQWQNIVIESRFGYPLQGTYITNPQATDNTLIFLHGFTESRLVGLNYLNIYLNAGFNILLVDSRAHGESGGNSVTWGNYEKYDLDRWVDWVQQRFPEGTIGVHGISMGAATALMHAELNEANKRVAFYIADSSYSDFETLLMLQMKQRLHLPGMVLPKLLLQYANVIAYLNSRFTFYQASPVRAVRNVTTPILYIHGEADKLVPADMSLELYNATKGPRQIYTFPNADHVSAIFDDRYRYGRVVQNFTHSIEQHS
ncbi:MAG: hypothetical protein K0R22_782 [Sporomusa sp.]|jgi:fermentation-respiration switch protein FrsA (DUF1100 family)|nr:hypothetical protein [Sporomusa sp.]